MSEINSWTESDWYALGSLVTQLAFLIAAVWFARNFLRTIRALQEQFGALLKLSLTSDPRSSGVSTDRHYADLRQYWLMPAQSSAPTAAESAQHTPRHLTQAAWHRLMLWLNAPMHTAEVSLWRRWVGWLQSPVGS